MSIARAKSLAKHWKAGFIDIGMAGHINLASGHGAWPAGLMMRDELIGRSGVTQVERWFGLSEQVLGVF